MSLDTGFFVSITRDDCPVAPESLPECSYSMTDNELCEANETLPDGTTNFEVDNCPNDFDVFRYVLGKLVLKSKCCLMKYSPIDIHNKHFNLNNIFSFDSQKRDSSSQNYYQ